MSTSIRLRRLRMCVDALKPSELVDRLELGRILRGRKWHVQKTCANTGDGVYEAMESLSRLVKDFRLQRRYR